jgi:hypothetical protein
LTPEPEERRIQAGRVLREAVLNEETVNDAKSEEPAEGEHGGLL